MASFFQTNGVHFDPWATPGPGKGLRNCQLGAYWAVWSHFTSTTKPALVSLPTGAGKTALMMALSFGLKATRVLIITPAATLRDQTAEKFRELDDLKTASAISQTVPSPKVLSNGQQLTTRKAWHELRLADVVVATPKTTSPSEPGIYAPPRGIFDLIFIDEAHHAPAPTWAAILRAFDDARCVLLTATPFRRDNRLIHAPLVYHYSIAKALDDNIYRPVKYEAVDAPMDRSSRDAELCKRAAQILKKEHKKGL